MHGPSRERIRLAIADLRHEAGVGAETAADIVVLGLPIQVARVVPPQRLERGSAERLSVPFPCEVRTIRRLRIAHERLTGDRVRR
jgi:hypothetical protein